MPILNENQITKTYFEGIGGFPGLKIIHELQEYNCGGRACVACTQLNGEKASLIFSGIKTYSERDKKRIQREWIRYLSSEPTEFKALHFNSHVSQPLFNATCCQEALEELRFKWGSYTDLSALANLKRLRYLYIGSGAGITDITPLARLERLVVLHVEGFKKVEDYSPLANLKNLEQLVISGPNLGLTPVSDLEFLKDMPNLRSIWLCNVQYKKRFSAEELRGLREQLPALYDINGCLFGKANLRSN